MPHSQFWVWSPGSARSAPKLEASTANFMARRGVRRLHDRHDLRHCGEGRRPSQMCDSRQVRQSLGVRSLRSWHRPLGCPNIGVRAHKPGRNRAHGLSPGRSAPASSGAFRWTIQSSGGWQDRKDGRPQMGARNISMTVGGAERRSKPKSGAGDVPREVTSAENHQG